ncbi:hypothetical protein GCM10010932_26870 [Agromyces flavus]|nr:hypothetical protein GCM10010932_26870 [Agromyces flavus]
MHREGEATAPKTRNGHRREDSARRHPGAAATRLTAAPLVVERARTRGMGAAARTDHRTSPTRYSDRQESRVRHEWRAGFPRRAIQDTLHAVFTRQMRTIQ